MRSRNHDTRCKSFLADQAGHAGRGDDSRKRAANAFPGEPGGNLGGNMRPGFAGIRADQHSRAIIPHAEVAPDAPAGPIKGLVVQRIFAGYTADTVSSEEFFGHWADSVAPGFASRAS